MTLPFDQAAERYFTPNDMNFYQRERRKYQQPATDAPCLNCGAKPAENSHLIAWFNLRLAGFPASLISGEWNLVPLCRSCHWLYDGRGWFWVGHQVKLEVIDGKERTKRWEAGKRWEQEYPVRREKILDLLKPKQDEAIKKLNELAKQYLLQVDLKIGEPWSERAKITQFDISHIREDGMIRVFIWRELEKVSV